VKEKDLILGMMPSRERDLNYAYTGLQQTHTSLVGIDDRGSPVFLGAFDDPGIYYLFPKLASLLQCNVVLLAQITYLLIIIFATTIIWFSFKDKAQSMQQKILLSSVCLFLFALNIFKSDVYTFSYLGVAIIPYGIRQVSMHKRYSYMIIFILVALSFKLNFFRSHSGTISLVFFAFYFLFVIKKWKTTVAFFASVALVFIANYFITNNIAENRNKWFTTNTTISIDESLSHPFWHSAYIGLGFLPNSLGLSYNDQVAMDKVYSMHPGVLFCGKVYETTLKQEYLKILKMETWYFVKVHLVKIFMVLGLFLFLLNIQIKKLLKLKLSQSLILPFAASILFAALPAIIVVPRINYLNAFITLCLVLFLHLSFIKNANNSVGKLI
jgi:hypothetical protein